MNTACINSAKKELTIIIPTYNEKENIYNSFNAIDKVLAKSVDWEVLYMDDNSPDGTSETVKRLSKENSKVRGIKRLGQRGLSYACIEGILASSSSYICIMDADLQHDEKLLPKMLFELKTNDVDIVVGSRYVDKGSTGDLPEHRVLTSKLATLISNYILKQYISDPMSGFFMFPRSFFELVENKLSGKGYKILLDMLITAGAETKIKELPYTMRSRNLGKSKLDYFVIHNFLLMLADKYLGKAIPKRFLFFILVGISGLFVHIFVLWLAHIFYAGTFVYSQMLAILVAMTSNYFMNNYFTYHDKKLTGVKHFKGLINFYVMCSFGALISILVANYFYTQSVVWWLAGPIGAVSGAFWNFLSTAIFIWKEKNRRL